MSSEVKVKQKDIHGPLRKKKEKTMQREMAAHPDNFIVLFTKCTNLQSYCAQLNYQGLTRSQKELRTVNQIDGRNKEKQI